jgi:hypothetical protein
MSGIFKNRVKIIGSCIAAFILGIAIFEFLPFFVQNIIYNTISKKNLPISLKVRDVGLWGSDFSEISVGAGEPFVSIDSVRVDFSPVGLLQKKLNKVSLSGIELNLHFQDGKLSLPWQVVQETQDPESVSDTPDDYHLEELYNLGEISIDRAVINVSSGNNFFSIPCSFNVQINEASPRLISIRAELLVREQQITITAKIDLETKEVRTDMGADSLDLIRFADLFEINNDFTASGSLGVKAETHFGLTPLSLISAEVSGKLEQADIGFGEMRITNINSKKEQPFLLNLAVDNDKGRFTSTSLAIGGLIEAEVGGLDLSLSKSGNGFSFEGGFSLNIPEQKTAAALSIAPVHLVTVVHGDTDKDGGWQLQAAASDKQTLGISQPGFDLSSQITDYSLTASGKAGQTTFQYNVHLSPLNIAVDNFSLQLSEFSASGKTVNGKSTFVLPFEDFVFTENGDLSAKANGRILFSWPYQPGTENSQISIDDIQLADLALGGVSLNLKQEPMGFKIEARYQSALIDNLCIDLTGYADFLSDSPVAEIQFKNACDKPFSDLDLGRFAPNLSGYYADAELNTGGNLLYKDGRFSGKIDTKIKNIRLSSMEKEFTLEGGSLDIHLTELPRIKTGPKQKFSFQSLKFGNITAGNGLVEFQIESPESIFIEKSQLEWSDGHVYTQALRFSPKIKDYDLIFFCDRLHFAKVLEQLGAATADGQGRVNGRVPVRITDGKFFLKNGFLYSTPGEGGKIKLTETDLLTEGIPKKTPQFAQIDLAREALKDFSYEWTKLDINSESEEDLLLHLQINGKPSNPLPFVYSKEFGGFARVDASSPGSRFQGIKLDVNFRLPLNQVLHYGDSIKSLIE